MYTDYIYIHATYENKNTHMWKNILTQQGTDCFFFPFSLAGSFKTGDNSETVLVTCVHLNPIKKRLFPL